MKVISIFIIYRQSVINPSEHMKNSLKKIEYSGLCLYAICQKGRSGWQMRKTKLVMNPLPKQGCSLRFKWEKEVERLGGVDYNFSDCLA